MGWKGTLRSVNAELNRQSRANAKAHKQHIKEVERADDFSTVQEHQNYLKRVVSLHRNGSVDLDLGYLNFENEPSEPVNNNTHVNDVQAKIDNYTPNILDKAFRLQNRRKKGLQSKLVQAKEQDKEIHKSNLSRYKEIEHEWSKKKDILHRSKNDKNALLELLEEYLDIENENVGSEVSCSVIDNTFVEVDLIVNIKGDVIPDEDYSLRQSGTLSTKKMPLGKGFELYQDHVCSSLMRVAVEVLGILPVEMIRANALINQVNTQTGHLENQVVVSAIVPRDTLRNINLKNIDPSDALNNFIHSMKFRKTKGFDVVEKIDFPE